VRGVIDRAMYHGQGAQTGPQACAFGSAGVRPLGWGVFSEDRLAVARFP
jgi:hypothetical protein